MYLERGHNMALLGLGTYLASGKADLIVHGNLENRVSMLQLHNRWTSEVSVGIIAVSKGEAVDTAVALIVCRPIVQESPNASSLVIC